MSLLQIKLINRLDISNYVQISKSVNEDKLNEMIVKVQIAELLPLLGESLFNDLMTTPTSLLNQSLLNGSSYIVGSETYVNYGLKSVLAHYVDAYYKMFGDATDTPFGLVNKLNGNESRPVEQTTKKTLYTENRKTAFNIWLNVEKYLIRTQNDLFLKNANCSNKSNARSFNISKII